MSAQTVPVRLTVTVQVDADGWTADYGVEGTTAIRKDAKEYALSLLRSVENFVEVK